MTTDEQITQIMAKSIIKGFVVCCIFAVTSLLLFNWCNRPKPIKPITKPNIDTITPKIKAKKDSIKVLNDSLPYYKEQARKAWERKQFYKSKYISLLDSIYTASDSVCKNNITILNNVKLKQDSAHEAENIANLLVISNQGKQIELYQDNQKLYDLRHKKDSSYIKELSDSIPKAFKLGLRKGRKQGFIAGVAVSGAVWIGSKITR